MGPLFWARRSPTRAARLRQHCGDVSLVEEGHGACGPVHKSTFSDVRRATPDLATGAGVCAGVTVGVVVVVAVVAAALARWIGGAGGETAAPAAAALQQRQQSILGAAHNGFPRLGEETAHAAESAVVPPPPSGSTDAPVDALPCTASHRCTAAPLHRHPVETSRSFLAAVAGRRHCTATTRIRADEGGGPASSPVCSPRTLPPSLAPAINRHVCLTVVAPYRLSCAGCGMLWCVCPVFLSLFSSLLSSPPFFPPTPSAPCAKYQHTFAPPVLLVRHLSQTILSSPPSHTAKPATEALKARP